MNYLRYLWRNTVRSRSHSSVEVALACGLLLISSLAFAAQPAQSLELSRAVRPWEFAPALGTRAAILGSEQGTFEAWVYPVKILTNFHLRFHVDGTILPAENLARTLVVRPQSTTIIYAGDSFSVRETWFVPVDEPGAVIALEVETTKPIAIEAVFDRDFQLEWPGNIGGTGEEWDPDLHAFRFGDDAGRFQALVGSPSATKTSQEFSSNYFASHQESFVLDTVEKGSGTELIVITASLSGDHSELASQYGHLFKDYATLAHNSADYYRDYLARTVQVHLPDAQIESAYDWARVSMLQGVVKNPFLGEGLVAGFDKSVDADRPGFAWFFGRDAEWTSFALDAAGDFATARNAMDFLTRFQRADGKIPHEISQSAGLMEWFKMPWAFSSADATPLFLIAVNDYVTRSGDLSFARERWDNLSRAYEFLKSTYDPRGLAQNQGVGHGWIEGGPLYPVQSELYQASLGVEATRAFSHLAHLVGKDDVAQDMAHNFDRVRGELNRAYWSPEKQYFAYARDKNGKRIDIASVLATVPMWFQLLNEDQTKQMIQELARPEHETDWGMRILSSRDAKYDPSGYHFGVVWPLFTGWASVGEYRYHYALPAYLNLRTNALLTFDGSLGHVTEALSGDFYQTLSTGSPDQIWSAAMVVNPLLTGLFGLQTDANSCRLDFAPHVPADWNSFSIENVRLGENAFNLRYQRTADSIRLEIGSTGARQCTLEFSPAVSLRAQIKRVRLNGHVIPFHIAANFADQHVTVNLPVGNGKTVVDIALNRNFEVTWNSTLPELGSTSRGLRLLSESWSTTRDALTMILTGKAGQKYELLVSNPDQVSSVDGGQLEKTGESLAKLRIQLPPGERGSDGQATVIFHFVAD